MWPYHLIIQHLVLLKFQIESWSLPLWVVRHNNVELNYNDELANPQSAPYKELADSFEKGIAESYAHTPLKDGFVVAEVNKITRPSDLIKVYFITFCTRMDNSNI